MPVRDVWFWLPFHMLQAYPMVRNLPIPDFFIPFAHLIWVPAYLWEHWAGLCEPVEGAWEMKSWIIPVSGLLLLAFFYYSHKLSESKLTVKVGFVLYFGFMLGAKPLVGFSGSPKKTYDDQIAANADEGWNGQHLILHVWYIVILWVVALTVPMQKLSLVRAGVDVSSMTSTASDWFKGLVTVDNATIELLAGDISLLGVLKEVVSGETLLPDFSSISRTSKYLALQGVIYAFTGLLMLLVPNSGFNKVMFFPAPFPDEVLPFLRMAGFTLFAVGWYFMNQSRTDDPYWIIVGILPRICFVIPTMLSLYFIWDAPLQLAGTFLLLDPTLAYTTFLSLKEDVKKKNYTQISDTMIA